MASSYTPGSPGSAGPPGWGAPQGQAPAPGAPPPAAPGPAGGPERPEPTRGGNGIMDFVLFRTMITPGLITIIWVLGFVGITIAAILSIDSADGVGVGILTALLVWIVGNIYLRVVLELMIVLFRIYGRLGDVERNTRQR